MEIEQLIESLRFNLKNRNIKKVSYKNGNTIVIHLDPETPFKSKSNMMHLAERILNGEICSECGEIFYDEPTGHIKTCEVCLKKPRYVASVKKKKSKK